MESNDADDEIVAQWAAGLRDALLGRPELFVTTLSEKLLTYALGRGVEYYDAPAVRAMVRVAAEDEHRFSALILGVVQSPQFQMRRARGLPSTGRAADN